MPQPEYYADTAVKIDAMAVMDYLHPALANAFKYLVRAGNKPDNPWDKDARKALTYLYHWQHFKNTQPECPEAFTILKFFGEYSIGDVHQIIAKSHDIESFVAEAIKFIEEKMDSNDHLTEIYEYQNEIARLRHEKIPYPEFA